LEAELELEDRVESVLAVQEHESKQSRSYEDIPKILSNRSTDNLVVPDPDVLVGGSSSESPLPPVISSDADSILERDDIPDILHFANYMSIMYNKDPENSSFLGQILHINKDNDVYQSPYLVSVDEEWKTIVIAVSLS
jgi:hypothetical protein